MKLFDRINHKSVEAEVVQISDEEYTNIKKSGQFVFDWSLEKEKEVFKIVTGEQQTSIQGLISLTNIPEEFRIHINLLESANSNKGKHKKLDYVAGCLVAFAIQVSFEQGYYGFTSLLPKTQLIPLYKEKYGFSQYGRYLAIEGKEAIKLIQKYV
mgnify:CR=1 FL=1